MSAERMPEPLWNRVQAEDGWDGRGSKATTEAVKATVAALVMIPMVDGGMMLDWSAGGMEIEVEVRPDGSIDGITVYRAKGYARAENISHPYLHDDQAAPDRCPTCNGDGSLVAAEGDVLVYACRRGHADWSVGVSVTGGSTPEPDSAAADNAPSRKAGGGT